MYRGEIRLIDLDPVRGAEANKKRPAVIVSNDGANARVTKLAHGVITVVPVTSNVQRIHPFQVLLPAAITGLAADSKAQAEQIRSIAVGRVGSHLGEAPPALMAQLDAAIRLHLAL